MMQGYKALPGAFRRASSNPDHSLHGFPLAWCVQFEGKAEEGGRNGRQRWENHLEAYGLISLENTTWQKQERPYLTKVERMVSHKL